MRTSTRRLFGLPVLLLVAVALVALGCNSSEVAQDDTADSGSAASARMGDVVRDSDTGATTADLDAATRPVSDAGPLHVPDEPASTGDADAPRPAQPSGVAAEQAEALRIADQEARQAYAHFMRIGRERQAQGRFDEAVRAFEEATRLQPGSDEARRALANARQLLGHDAGRSFSQFQSMQDRDVSQVSEALAQIRLKYEEGKELFDNRNYKDAIATLSEALEIARWMRGRVDVGPQVRYIQGLIDKARELAEVQRSDDLRYNQLLVDQIREVERQNRVRRWREEIRTLYDAAKDQFDREEYDECLITLTKLLWKDPYNEEVIELREYCRNLKYQKRNRDLRRSMARMWQHTALELEEASIPFLGERYAARLPSIERWREIEARAQAVLARQVDQDDPEVARIKEALEQTNVNVSYDEHQLSTVLQNLADTANINIITTQAVNDMPEDALQVDLDLGNVKLGSALRLILDLLDLDYWIENGAVIVGAPDEAEGQGVIVRIFSVRDLLGGFRNFPGEQIRLDRDEPDWQAQDDDVEPILIELDELPDIILESVAPDSWNPPADVTIGPNGTLIVSNTPEVLSQVADLLDDLRSSRGLMVTLEIRIIEVQDNFLEELGIDYRGAGGVPPGAVGPNLTTAPLDDFQFGLGMGPGVGTTPLVGRDQSAGFYISNAPSSEVRARIEHMFDQALGDPDIMTRSGGASFQFAFLNRVQLNAILRAVKKRERMTLVTAPKITCFNTQRANITVRNQVAYIEDFDVEAQQNISIADPVIQTIEDGLVMDVRPVISADRRYITVELQPTIALLQRPMDTLTTTLGGPGSTPVTIQLPELQIQRIRTTVTVPDGGSFLIGGVRRVDDITQETGIPLLSDIPIIGNLFSRQGRSNLKRDLVIVVKARITDLREMIDLYDPGSAGGTGGSASFATNPNPGGN